MRDESDSSVTLVREKRMLVLSFSGGHREASDLETVSSRESSTSILFSLMLRDSAQYPHSIAIAASELGMMRSQVLHPLH